MGMTIEEAKKLDQFLCSDCSSDDDAKGSLNSFPISPSTEAKVKVNCNFGFKSTKKKKETFVVFESVLFVICRWRQNAESRDEKEVMILLSGIDSPGLVLWGCVQRMIAELRRFLFKVVCEMYLSFFFFL